MRILYCLSCSDLESFCRITDALSSRAFNTTHMNGTAGTQALNGLTHLRCDLAVENLLFPH